MRPVTGMAPGPSMVWAPQPSWSSWNGACMRLLTTGDSFVSSCRFRRRAERGTPKGPPLVRTDLLGRGLGLIGAGVLAPLDVVPLVKCQPGGCLEEATRRAVAGDELGRLVPSLEVDEDPVGSTWFVDGHSNRGDGLAGCGGDLHFGIGAESAGDGNGIHGI